MGYHNNTITKGVYGQFSKIQEEFQELEDAMQQKDKILALVELTDLIGAIEGFVIQEFPGIALEDLIKFQKLTKRSFESGDRK